MLQKWPCSGPITSMFWRYLLACGVPFPAKIRMIAYLCTYISMAFAFYGIVGYLAVSFLPISSSRLFQLAPSFSRFTAWVADLRQLQRAHTFCMFFSLGSWNIVEFHTHPSR